ncbi:MAG: ATP-dependent helicase HrpB [Colwellia sp.]
MSALIPLPIEAIKAEFCQTIVAQNTVILSAPPGAGKSTCLPLWLLSLFEFSTQKIYLLQPRRLAVKNIATYLATQLNEQVGETVGYRLRNENKVSKNTRLEVITEGILTQIIQQDAELENCALVIFDEFHERSLHGDLAFALTREVQQSLRDNLKILLMSATLDNDHLAKVLPDAVSLISQGRSFPIEVSYQAPANIQRWRDHALNVIKEKLLAHQGSILVFLPGVGDIRFLADCLNVALPQDVLLCPLFGDLTLKQQQQAIAPCLQNKRKIVLATNIAETSLTIEGINLVIDCGFEKVAVYDSASLLNKLAQKQIAKASAVQRAGRAGRLMAGQCIRLYSKDDFERRPEQSSNEIQQADLLPTLIEAARWGVTCLSDLPMLELPSEVKEQQAWQELQSLAIVNKSKKLTKHGEKVAQLACHPRFAHMILSAQMLDLAVHNGANNQHDTNLESMACLLAALLEERDIFSSKNQNHEQALHNCDLSHRLQSFTNGRHYSGAMLRIVKQAKVLAKRLGIYFSTVNLPITGTGLLLALAYPERVAKSRVRDYSSASNIGYGDFICANGKGVTVNEQDALAAEQYLVFADLMHYKGLLKARLAASISFSQIEAVFAEQITEQQKISFDESTGKIIARKQTKFAALVLNEQIQKQTLSANDISLMWCDLIQQKGLKFLNWQAKDLALLARWRWLTRFCPQFNLPETNEVILLSQLTLWFSPFVGKIKNKNQLDKVNLSSMLLSLLNYQQQQLLNQAAPAIYIGPTGRHCPIHYSEEKSPKVSLPMQELYGLTNTPSVGIADNYSVQAIPLVLELLSPAQRPIQVTQNLVQFWQGSYKAVQKDMKSRYPKHYWPDDPANAKPTNKTKRHLKNS